MKSFVLSAVIFIILFISFMCHGGIGNNNYNLIPIVGEVRIYRHIANIVNNDAWTLHPGEAKIYGRLARSETSGIFSDAGLMGFCYPDEDPYNYKEYKNEFSCYKNRYCQNYVPYESQSGGQGLIYSIMDKLYKNPVIFYVFCASFLSAVLLAWFWWLNGYWGLIPSLLIMSGILSFRGLMIYGDNIAHVLGATYLIMVALFWAYKKGIENVGTVTFIVVLLKFLLNGPEYLFSALILPFLPLVFYSVLNKMPSQRIKKDIFLITGGVVSASIIALLFLTIQVSIATSPAEAVHHFINRVMARTYFPDLQTTGQNIIRKITLWQLLHLYLSMPCISLGLFQISFKTVILFLFIVSILTFYLYRCYQQRILLALIATTWTSLLCPLSWILIAKGHSSTHPFIDQLVWHMPFTLLGMALIVVTLQTCVNKWCRE